MDVIIKRLRFFSFILDPLHILPHWGYTYKKDKDVNEFIINHSVI